MAVDIGSIMQMAGQQNALQPGTGTYANTVTSNFGNQRLTQSDDDWKKAGGIMLNIGDPGGAFSNTADWLSGGRLFGASDGDGEDGAPTLRDIFQEYPGIIQDLMDMSYDMAPQQAELQASMQEQYMPRLLQSQQSALESVYPQAAGLTELLAGQATEQMSGELTDSERRQFLDMQKSLVGGQSTAGIGTDYIGSNLLNYVNQRQQGAQQLGLQTAASIPQTTLQMPSYSDYSQQFTPGQFTGTSQGQQQLAYNMADSGMGGMSGIANLAPLIQQIVGGMGNSGNAAASAAGTTAGTGAANPYVSTTANNPYMDVFNTETPLSYSSIGGLGGNYYG